MFVRNGEYAYTDGDWHHFAVCTGAGDNRIYIDGLNESVTFHAGSSSTNEFSNIDNPDSMKIGARKINGGFSGYFAGTIDDVRIYDRVLSAEEVQELCLAGLDYDAFNPNPADGARNVDPNVVLSWSPGKEATSHDVYFGTDYNDVNDADTDSSEFIGNQDSNNYDPSALDLGLGTTYYWRIDEKDALGTVKGDVWSFRTWIDPNLLSWWEFDEGSGTIAYDSAGGNDGTLAGDPQWVAGQIGSYALDFDGVGDYVDLDSHISNIEGLNEGTVAGWFNSPANASHIIFSITEASTANNFSQVLLGPTTGA